MHCCVDYILTHWQTTYTLLYIISPPAISRNLCSCLFAHYTSINTRALRCRQWPPTWEQDTQTERDIQWLQTTVCLCLVLCVIIPGTLWSFCIPRWCFFFFFFFYISTTRNVESDFPVVCNCFYWIFFVSLNDLPQSHFNGMKLKNNSCVLWMIKDNNT